MPPFGNPTAVALVLRVGMSVAEKRLVVHVDRAPVIHPDGLLRGPRRRALPGINRREIAADPETGAEVTSLLNP